MNPITGIPIGCEGVQSREYCFPFKVLLAKDTKVLYQTHFKSFFEWTKALHKVGYGEYKPFKVGSPQDILSFWKSLGQGGACKRDKNFCHCCPVTSDNVITPNIVTCVDCVRQENDKCYHHPVGDKQYVDSMKDELKNMLERFSSVFSDKVIAQLTIKLAPEEIFASTDITNIDFEPRNREEIHAFSNKLNYNLALLKLPTRGNMSSRRELLREHLLSLKQMKLVQMVVNEYGVSLEKAMILVEMAIPCILHMENCVGERILKLLLIEGVNEHDSDKQAQEELIQNVQDTVNKKILGTERRKSN